MCYFWLLNIRTCFLSNGFKVRDYVEQTEHHLPLVVTGGPCTGKAVLLAHCARQVGQLFYETNMFLRARVFSFFVFRNA